MFSRLTNLWASSDEQSILSTDPTEPIQEPTTVIFELINDVTESTEVSIYLNSDTTELSRSSIGDISTPEMILEHLGVQFYSVEPRSPDFKQVETVDPRDPDLEEINSEEEEFEIIDSDTSGDESSF